MLDERDTAIRYKAGIAASQTFGIIVMAGAAALCALHRTAATVPTIHVAFLAYYGWMAMYLVWSVSVLVLYRRGS